MRKRQSRVLIGDFETTVYKGQEYTEVWASALVEINTDEVHIFHSLDETYEYILSLDTNLIIYYHNLKFDGAFWMSYLMTELKYSQSCIQKGEHVTDIEWIKDNEMPDKSFKYTISDMGQWYSIIIKKNRHLIEIRDSLKLLPFSVREIGKSFATKHKKLEIEYKGLRYAGCEITDKEKEYIANDVLVVKEALEIMFNDGNNKLTIGACCLSQYKKIITKQTYKALFPDLTEYYLPLTIFHNQTADEWIRKSYHGGWCYLAEGKENKIYNKGLTLDVNSLYPSMMSSESGNYYPTGEPEWWTGNYIPEEALKSNRYYFVRIKTRFYLKEGMLPFIQIKTSFLYRNNEMLKTSDVYDPVTKKYYSQYRKADGTIEDTRVELTLTMTDYILLQEHYDLVDFEILQGCYFQAQIGIFDEYINYYKEIKMNSTGARREEAKLFLNNLYGKMASSNASNFKVAYLKDNNVVAFFTAIANDKKAGYIPVGSAITSYARNFTIRTAQKNYYGADKAGFIYADTDSIHCDIPLDQIKGATIDDKQFCCWKKECEWDEAIFVRQKTYIEHVICEDSYYNIKCAGMPDKCKELFAKSISKDYSITNETEEEKEKMTDEEREFLSTKRTLKDFKIGLKIYGKLLPKRIQGGVVLTETTYEMR